MFLLWAAVVCCSCLGLCRCSEHDEHWTYDHQDAWPDKCVSGQLQSPIDIDTGKSIAVPAAPLHFRRYEAVPLAARNNGHTVKMTASVEEDEKPAVSGGPLVGEYVFEQLHFHWVGEHAIDHVKYPLEIHFVHRRRDVDISNFADSSNSLSVIAVLCKISADDEDSRVLRSLVVSAARFSNASSEETIAGTYDLRSVLADRADSYFAYSGSLTTPGCEEVVTWIVLDTPLSVRDTQYQALSALDVGGVSNYRAVQPRHSRAVYRAAAAAPRPASLSPAPLLAAILSHFYRLS